MCFSARKTRKMAKTPFQKLSFKVRYNYTFNLNPSFKKTSSRFFLQVDSEPYVVIWVLPTVVMCFRFFRTFITALHFCWFLQEIAAEKIEFHFIFQVSLMQDRSSTVLKHKTHLILGFKYIFTLQGEILFIFNLVQQLIKLYFSSFMRDTKGIKTFIILLFEIVQHDK